MPKKRFTKASTVKRKAERIWRHICRAPWDTAAVLRYNHYANMAGLPPQRPDSSQSPVRLRQREETTLTRERRILRKAREAARLEAGVPA